MEDIAHKGQKASLAQNSKANRAIWRPRREGAAAVVFTTRAAVENDTGRSSLSGDANDIPASLQQ